MTNGYPALSARFIRLCVAVVLCSLSVLAQSPARGQIWVASWVASPHGPYPAGNASAQPELKFAIESPQTGAVDQTFRLIVKPDLWGSRIRIRLGNIFGTQPVTFNDIFVGLQSTGGNVAAGTTRRVTFEGGTQRISVGAGRSTFSDPIDLPFVKDAADPLLSGRKLAVSFHVVDSSGPMTWHAKALTTSYLTAPRAGSHGSDETDAAFPFTTTSWYFLDAIDVMAPEGTAVIAAFGDSITDGTGSTLNGDDRWPDVLSRRLHAVRGTRVSVVNAGIGGNQVLGPAEYAVSAPTNGGPSALARLDHDILGISGLSTIVWLEGINDLSRGATADAVIAGMQQVVKRVRARGGARIIAATITSNLGSNNGTPDLEARRQAINTFIRTGGIFDGVADFDMVTRHPTAGSLRAEFQPNSTTGGPGDHLHPNRAGYQAMGNAIDLALLEPVPVTAHAK